MSAISLSLDVLLPLQFCRPNRLFAECKFRCESEGTIFEGMACCSAGWWKGEELWRRYSNKLACRIYSNCLNLHSCLLRIPLLFTLVIWFVVSLSSYGIEGLWFFTSNLHLVVPQVILAFYDPSNLPANPGWPLRNLLALASVRWGVTRLQVLCYRENRSGQLDLEHSPVLDIILPATPGW